MYEVDSSQDQRWGAFVASHPDGLIYHRPEWLRVLEHEFGRLGTCLICENDLGEIQGVLPLAWTRGVPFSMSARTGPRLSSLPRTPVAGPLALHEGAMTALVSAALSRVRDKPGARLELKPSGTGLPGGASGLAAVPWRKAYVLDLPSRPDDLRFGNSRNNARIKWAVRKANRYGVGVRAATSLEDVRSWYPVYLDTMRRLTIPPRPFQLFDAMWHLLNEHGLMRLLLAVQNGRLVAGSLYLFSGQTVFYAFNGCLRSEMSLRPNDVLQWHAIVDACRARFRYFDLGEVAADNEGLAEFKAKWGSREMQLYRYYDACPSQRPSDVELHKIAAFPRRLIRAGWQRLPLSVTAAVGKRIYSYM